MTLIYLIAGEASGDALGAGLMQALKLARPDVRFAGVGGEAMGREGLSSLFPYRELSVMGFFEVIPHIPELLKRLKETLRDIESKRPDAVVTIDSPGFNFRIASMLKKSGIAHGIKRIHYVAPSVWAYKPGRAAKTARLFDMLLAVLPFEPPYFTREGLNTVFVGHRALWQPPQGGAAAFRARHAIAPEERVLLVLPGSRTGEVKRHLSIFLRAAALCKGFRVCVLAGEQVRACVLHAVPSGVVVCDASEKYDAFAAADMAVSKSGTITLELAAHGVPTVAAHKVSLLSAWLIRSMILVKYVSLVNIVSDKEIIPELIQERCTPEAIAKALLKLDCPETKACQREEMAQAIAALRGGNAMHPDAVAAGAVLHTLELLREIR